MLYEDITTGAIVAGYMASTRNTLTGERAEAIEEALNALNAKHRTTVVMFVPGDSATDHAEAPEMELYAGGIIFGHVAVSAAPWDAPKAVDRDALQSALGAVKDIPGAFWKDLREKVPMLPKNFGNGAPKLTLACCGPLPYAALCYGVTHPSAERGSAVCTFYSCQDMNQEWMDEGVDGICVTSVEFTDVNHPKLGDAALEKYAKKTAKLTNPSLYMTVRYD